MIKEITQSAGHCPKRKEPAQLSHEPCSFDKISFPRKDLRSRGGVFTPARGRRRRPAGKARIASRGYVQARFCRAKQRPFRAADKDAAENQPLFAVEELRGLSVFTYPAQ